MKKQTVVGTRLKEITACMSCNAKNRPLYKAWVGGTRVIMCKNCMKTLNEMRIADKAAPRVAYANLARFWQYKMCGHTPSKRMNAR